MGEIGRTFVATYVDGFRIVRDLWSTVLLSLVAVFATNFVGGLFQAFVPTQVGDALVTTLAAVAAQWLCAPYTVAQYRYLFFGERVPWPSLFERSATVDRVFAWCAIVTFVWAVPVLVLILTRHQGDGPIYYRGPNPPSTHSNTGSVAFLVVFIAISMLRLVTLIPGTAFGTAPTIKRAVADGRGHFWVIAGTQFLIMLPLGVALILVFMSRALLPMPGLLAQPISLLVLGSVANVLSVAAGAQFYRRLVLMRGSD